MRSWIFSIITQFSESHDPSEIFLICWFGGQETFCNNIMNAESGFAA